MIASMQFGSCSITMLSPDGLDMSAYTFSRLIILFILLDLSKRGFTWFIIALDGKKKGGEAWSDGKNGMLLFMSWNFNSASLLCETLILGYLTHSQDSVIVKFSFHRC